MNGLLTALVLTAAPLELGAEVDAVVAAAGGEKAWRAAHYRKDAGRVTVGRTNASLTRLGGGAGKLRLEVVQPSGSSERRVLNAGIASKDGTPLLGVELVSIELQALRLWLPLVLLDRKLELVDKGLVDAGGRQVRRLEVPVREGVSLSADVDPVSHRIVGCVNRVSRQMSTVVLDDYREAGGLKVPFREVTVNGAGAVLSRIELESVELVATLPSQLFNP